MEGLLFQLLNRHTSEMGSWSLTMDDYKTCYYKQPKDIMEYYHADEEDFKDICFDKPIYELHWYDKGPVGFYHVFANSLDQMARKVFNLYKEW